MIIDYEDDGVIRWERNGEKKHAELIDLIEAYEDKQKHGRWIGINKNRYNDDEATCSICGVTFASDYSNPSWWDYCPNCGARMDGGENG